MVTIEKRGTELNPWKVINDGEVVGKIEIVPLETTEEGHTLKVGFKVVLNDGTEINCWEHKCAEGVMPFTHQHIINCVNL